MQILLLLATFTLAPIIAVGQTNSCPCHVYVVDVAAAKKAFEAIANGDQSPAAVKAAKAAETQFPEFLTTIAEERATQKIT